MFFLLLSITIYNTSYQANVTLIEKNSHLYYTFAALIGVTETGYAPKLWIPYDKLFKKNSNSKVIQASATSITDSEVTLSNGTSLKFDYLVIATGLVTIF